MSPTATVRTAVIPAAGLGTRFLPLTKAIPKELVPVVDRPAIHYVVQEALAAGIEHVVIVTSAGKGALEEYFTPSPQVEEMLRRRGNSAVADELRQFAERLTFSYPIQAEQRGLGHAVLCARDAVGRQPFAVILPDDLLVDEQPVLAQMVQAWSKRHGNYLAVEEVPADRISAYGVVDLATEGHLDGRTYRVKGLVEKPSAEVAPSNLGIVGRYILMPEVFDALARTRPGAIGEIQLTDGIALSMEHQPTYAYRFSGARYDCGTPLGLLHASLHMALGRADTAAQVRQWLKDL
ncbi:MAG: UTP--glucose-1-phosphate uridylyltransferase [Dehalococcoidia bacterium]|nr:UTP--glucose-1-phosphate uridylyltransferase [Dehalococcoidia bacterium]